MNKTLKVINPVTCKIVDREYKLSELEDFRLTQREDGEYYFSSDCPECIDGTYLQSIGFGPNVKEIVRTCPVCSGMCRVDLDLILYYQEIDSLFKDVKNDITLK